MYAIMVNIRYISCENQQVSYAEKVPKKHFKKNNETGESTVKFMHSRLKLLHECHA